MIKNNKNSTSLDIYFNEIGSGTGLNYFLRFLKSIFSPEADLFLYILKLIYCNLRFHNYSDKQLLFQNIDLASKNLLESLSKLNIHYLEEEKDESKEIYFRFLYNEFRIYTLSSPKGVSNVDLINLKNQENIKSIKYIEDIFIQNSLNLLKKQQFYKSKNEELRRLHRKKYKAEKKKKKQLKKERLLKIKQNLLNT